MTEREEIQQLKKELGTLQKKYDSKPFSMEGEVLFINPKEDKSSTVGKNFFVREICLKTTDVVNGQEYTNQSGFQFTGNACDLVEALGIDIGDTVKLFFTPKANIKESTKMVQDPSNPGSPYPLNPKSQTAFNNNNVYKVEGVYIANPNKYKTTGGASAQGGGTNTEAEVKEPIPQPEGEVPADESGKPMVWNETKGEFEKDDLPF